MSTPRTLAVPPQVSRTVLRSKRGTFASFEARPATGVSERQPALLVPGYTGSKEDFLAVLETLTAAGRTVVAIDMRGQYQSAPANGRVGYRLDRLGADVVAIAAAIADDAGRVHLLGHSFGGLVARAAVLNSPATFASLTLLSSGPGTIGGYRAQALADFLDFMRPAGNDLAAQRARIAQVWDDQLGPQALAEGAGPAILSFLRDRILGSSPVGLIEMARHLLDCPDRTPELAAITELPKLVSYGEKDDAWPPDVQDLMAARLGAERVCIPEAAHSPAVEAPETTAAMLTAFWNAAESRR